MAGTIRTVRGGFFARVTLDGTEHSKMLPTEADAAAWIEDVVELHEQARKGRLDPTLAIFGREWLDAREVDGYVRHVRQERSVWKSHVLTHPIADRPLRSLTRRHLVEWTEWLSERLSARGKTLDRQSQKHAVRLVRTCLQAAQDKGLISGRPGDQLRAVKVREEREDDAWTWLTQDEIDAVLALEHGEPRRTMERRALFAVAIYCGLRKSELLHLRWERVHLDGQRPRIEVRAPLKSRSARRDVPLLPPAIDALRAWRSEGGVKRVAGLVWPADKDDLARGAERRGKKKGEIETGRHHDSYDGGWSDHPFHVVVKGKTVKRARAGAKSRAGIERPVRFHDLRHTYCSHLVQGTWARQPHSLYEVRDLAGHSDIKVTQRYAHLSPEGAHATAAAQRAEWTQLMEERRNARRNAMKAGDS